ncbi:MAG: glycerophosphodiester phosphodiesterase family protein [Tissierellales bacterium]
MKIQIIQPMYPKNNFTKDQSFNYIIKSLRSIQEADLILLPEYSNVPGADNFQELLDMYKKNNDILLKEVESTAKRLSSLVVVNVVKKRKEDTFTNTSLLYNRQGQLVFEYDKQHLTYGETKDLKLDHSYKHRQGPHNRFEIEGMRLAFLTCYDAYFLSYIESISEYRPDLILMPSYQRSEDADLILAQSKMIAQRCNSYLLRSSYSMEDKYKGGRSLICDTSGKILGDLEEKVGLLTCDIDISKKSLRSNGHGQALIASDLFVSQGKTPRAYSSAGSFIGLNDNEAPYPRLCAHRGFSDLLPENSILSIASAIALGAQEVEFDLWPTSDYEIIATHDPSFSHDPEKRVWLYTYEEILKLDASFNKSELLKGLQYNTFEEILKKFNKQTIMNIHIKTKYHKGQNEFPYDEKAFKIIADLIEKYDCQDYVYIAGDDAVMETALKIAPHLKRCCLDGQRDYSLVDNAIKYKCHKLQFFKPFFNQEMIDKAKKNNIICNIFYADDPKEALDYLDMGIDTVLTNNFFLVQKYLKENNRL